MTEDAPRKAKKRARLDALLWIVASLDPKEITDDEIEHFRQYTDQSDEVSSPLNLHKLCFWAPALLSGPCSLRLQRPSLLPRRSASCPPASKRSLWISFSK